MIEMTDTNQHAITLQIPSRFGAAIDFAVMGNSIRAGVLDSLVSE
jgi:hypothetical protein